MASFSDVVSIAWEKRRMTAAFVATPTAPESGSLLSSCTWEVQVQKLQVCTAGRTLPLVSARPTPRVSVTSVPSGQLSWSISSVSSATQVRARPAPGVRATLPSAVAGSIASENATRRVWPSATPDSPSWGETSSTSGAVVSPSGSVLPSSPLLEQATSSSNGSSAVTARPSIRIRFLFISIILPGPEPVLPAHASNAAAKPGASGSRARNAA